MLGLLAFGSVSFWIIVVVECLLLLILTEYEKPGWGAFSLIGLGALFYFVADVNLLAVAWTHPFTTLAYVLGYFMCGTGWSVVKWFFYVHRRRDEYMEAKTLYSKAPEVNWERVAHGGIKGEPVEVRKTWEDSHARSRFKNRENGIIPLVGENKGRIIMWMSYWPWSALWTVIDDPIKKAFRAIFNRIQGQLQNIANKVFWDVT